MRTLPSAALFTSLVIGLVAAAPADQRTLTLDPAATTVRFTLGATLHKVEGSVRVDGGEIRFGAAGGPASGRIVVDAKSADTGHEGRDADMHRKVLESERFGRFVLRPTETIGDLAPTGTSRIELHGELEIYGGAHPVSLPAELTVDGERLSGTATLTVPYVEWGMKNPSKLFLRVEKLVEVQIDLVGTLSQAAPESE